MFRSVQAETRSNLTSHVVQAYVRFAKLKLHVQNSKYPEFAATGELPQLRDGNFLVGRHDIISHLQTVRNILGLLIPSILILQHHINMDEMLEPDEKAQVFAFSTMIHTSLHKTLLYSRYVDSTNYREVTRPALCKALPAPLKSFMPGRLQKEMKKKLHDEGFSNREHVFTVARDCYAALNARLGTGSYFFSNPTSLDAIVFGHVVDALNDVRLKELVLAYAPELVRFAKNIRDTYFSSKTSPDVAANATKSGKFEQAMYTTNTENAFTLLNSAFMEQDSTTIDDAWITEPYKSLSSTYKSRPRKPKPTPQELAALEEESALNKKGTRAIIGGCVAMALYMLSILDIDIVDEDED